MAIKQISVETEIDVKQYTASPTDPIENYPVDCWKGSTLTIMDSTGKIAIGHAIFDGIKWEYVKTKDDVAKMFTYENVGLVGTKYTLPMEYKRFNKFVINPVPTIQQSLGFDIEGSVTTAGDVTLTMTSDSLEVPMVLTVALTTDDTHATIAQKFVNAVNNYAYDPEDEEDVDIATLVVASFIVTSDPEEVLPDVYTMVFTSTLPAGKADATLDFSLALLDAEGITPVVTSTEFSDGFGTEAKSVEIKDVPRDCIVELLIDCDADVSITFGDGFTFSDTVPAFEVGNVYELKFITRDGGTNWLSRVIASWVKS